jgi:signal transduction histidine kinase
MKSPGLRGRLVLTTVLAALGAVSILVVGLQVLLEHMTDADSVDVLHSRADAAAATVRGGPGHVKVLDSPSDSLDQNIWIFDLHGRMVDGNSPTQVLAPAVGELSMVRSPAMRSVAERYRLYGRPVREHHGGPVTGVVVAGIDLTPYESSEQRGLTLSLMLGFLTVFAAGAASWVAARYSLRQVQHMAHRADDWSEHDLSRRFDLGRPTDELTELGDILDRMLDRIAQAILAERRLTDEVAHELRNPLAVIRSEAQLAMLDDASRDNEESLRGIIDATERMDRSITMMLTVARATHSEERRCTATDVLQQVCATTVAPDGVRLETVPPDGNLTIGAPAPVVVAALAPLAENALRHARGLVRLSAYEEGRRVLVSVYDDGPGVAEGDREAIFVPGHTTTADGAGLGLALARRLVHSIGGEIEERGNGHGLFVADLPEA